MGQSSQLCGFFLKCVRKQICVNMSNAKGKTDLWYSVNYSLLLF